MPEPRKGQSLWQDAWKRLKKNRFAMGGLVVVIVMSLLAILAPWIVPFEPDYGQPWVRAQAPGYRHPAVPAALRFDKGEPPFVPETFPSTIADCISRDGVIRYTVDEIVVREYRVRLRRGKVSQIKEGALSRNRLEVSGTGFVQVIGAEDALGNKIRDVTIVKKKPLPEPLADTKGRVLMLKVTRPRAPEPEEIEVVIAGGKVDSITRRGEVVDSLRVDGRYVLSVEKDGEKQEFVHRLGTDLDGRDVLSRVIYGGRISLMVGCVATIVSVLIGVVYGAVAGYLSSQKMTVTAVVIAVAGLVLSGLAFRFVGGGIVTKGIVALVVLAGGIKGLHLLVARVPLGWLRRNITTTGEFMMRLVDILYGLPYMFLVILLMISFGRDIRILFVALGLLQWLTMARIVRGQVLSLKEKEFVEAARMCGAGHAGILFRHLIPNTLGVVVVYTTLTVPAVILQESFLAFIGLTVEYQGRTLDSWGSLVNEGRKALTSTGGNWWVLLYPSFAMALTLFSLNFLGDGLRDALDPQLKGRT